MNQYKIAVCISGQTRTFNYCKESLLEFFPNCDFYCHTYDYNSYHEPGISPILDDWEETIIDDIKNTLNPIDFKLTTREESVKLFKSIGWSGDEGAINNYSMVYSILESFNYDLSKYDFVIKTRYDLIYDPRPERHLNYFLRNSIDDYDFLTDGLQLEEQFAFNDALFVCGKETAKLISEYKKEFINIEFPTNKTFIDFLINNGVKVKLIEQPWQIVRPRYTRQEKDWKKLFIQYRNILWNDPSHLPGKSKEYFERNPV